jgi:hypothetical protein
MGSGEQVQTTQRLVFGVILLGLGVVFLLDRLDVFDPGHLWDYWPLVFAAVGLSKLLQPATVQGRGFGAILVIVGVWWTLDNLDLVPYGVWDLWPVFLILAGANLLWRALSKAPAQPTMPPPPPPGSDLPIADPDGSPMPQAGVGYTSDPTVSMFALLGGMTRRCSSRAFAGGDLTAVMGGCELDLRQAEPAGGRAEITVFALWGGIEIRVPPDWAVIIEGTPIMAAIEDSRRPTGVPLRATLVVRGAAIMAGVEIKS